MRGKISEAQRSLVKKLYEKYNMSIEDIAEQVSRSVDSVKVILGMAPSPEPKTRTAFTPGYEQITATLDRGDVKFYLPKDLTDEDVEGIIDAIVVHYGLQTADDILMEIEPERKTRLPDKYEKMRRIIEETAMEAEETATV